MSAKQARRKKAPVVARRVVLRLPTALVRRSATLIGVLAIGIAAALFARSALDVPITAMAIDAPFQRVTSMQLSEAVGDRLQAGFLSVDLDEIRRRVESLAWVDNASVRRVWPDRIHIVVSEQVPAARWGDHGLLNVRGELFIEAARHDLAELPRLSGPQSEVRRVAAQYLALRGPLIEAGLGLRAVTLDARGAWQIVLGNGIEVKLGRQQTDARATRFVDIAAPVVARHETKIRYVDMRYSNGFSIGWKREEYRQQVRMEAAAATAAVTQGKP